MNMNEQRTTNLVIKAIHTMQYDFNNKEKRRLSMGYHFGNDRFPFQLGMSYGGYDSKSIGFGCGMKFGIVNLNFGIGYKNSFNIKRVSGFDFGIDLSLLNL